MEVISNIGDLVVCDFCNGDGTESLGGVLIGSHAVCGNCCVRDKYIAIQMKNIKLGSKFINVSHGDFVFDEIISELDSVKITHLDNGYKIRFNTNNNIYIIEYSSLGMKMYSKDEITEIWDLDKTFQKNVLDYRIKTTGTSDGISTFMTFDEFNNLNKESKK